MVSVSAKIMIVLKVNNLKMKVGNFSKPDYTKPQIYLDLNTPDICLSILREKYLRFKKVQEASRNFKNAQIGYRS